MAYKGNLVSYNDNLRKLTDEANKMMKPLEDIETTIGDATQLQTTSKSIIPAINEVNNNIGDKSQLATTDKSNVVKATNEINAKIGDVSKLSTTAKSDVVSAVNEVSSTAKDTKQSVDTLSTTATAHIIDYVLHPGYGTTTGTNSAYILSLNPVPISYTDGMSIRIKVHVDSAPDSTININTLGAKALKTSTGTSVTMKKDSIYTFVYNSTTGNFILQGEGGASVDPTELINSVNNILSM